MIRTIVRDIWQSRELLHQFVLRDLRLRYRQAVMGVAWALLMPCLTILAGLVVRGALARAGGDAPSLAGVVLKSWGWAFFAGSLNFATMSLLANIALVTKIWFPREVLPLSAIAAQAVDAGVGLLLLAVLLPFLGADLGLAALWLPVLLVLLVGFTTGVGMLLACANLFLRDVKYILQVVLTFGIFFTPVLLEPAQMGRLGAVAMLNPLAPILEGLRLAVVVNHDLLTPLQQGGVVTWQPWWLGYSLAWTLVTLWLGLRTFRGSAARFAEAY